MCDTTPSTGSLKRRSLLGAAMAGAGGVAMAATIGTTAADAAPRKPGSNPRRPYLPVRSSQPKGHALTLLGTSGGPQAEYVRTGTSSVLTIGGRNYVVDAGRSSVTQYLNAGLRFSALGGMFITHLHADHLADYYNYFLLEGGEKNAERDNLTGPLTVFGPGSAGALPPSTDPDIPVIAPDNPTPGIADLTKRLNEGYAYSYNVFMRDTGTRDIETLQDVHEIGLPDVGASSTNTAPSMDPFFVWEDDRVRVTAILVPHGSVFPSFAYRFDSEDGSVVFSGDTKKSENVIKLAHGADVLVHEVMNLAFLETVGHVTGDLLDHLKDSHTTTRQVAQVARQADVPQLVLTHLVPSNPRLIPDAVWHAECQIGYRGRVHVGNDLDRITWSRRRR